jgi:hypothetical protein
MSRFSTIRVHTPNCDHPQRHNYQQPRKRRRYCRWRRSLPNSRFNSCSCTSSPYWSSITACSLWGNHSLGHGDVVRRQDEQSKMETPSTRQQKRWTTRHKRQIASTAACYPSQKKRYPLVLNMPKLRREENRRRIELYQTHIRCSASIPGASQCDI